MKICLIDDESICRLIAQKSIEKILPICEIISFTNGQTAFDFFARHYLLDSALPDLIILDINMPVADGWKFLDMLQGLDLSGYFPRIYISSSSIDTGDVARAKTYASVHGYLPKPLNPEMLKTIFRDMEICNLGAARQTKYQHYSF